MVSTSGAAIDPDEIGAILDIPILVSSTGQGELRIAYLNPESALAAGVPLTALTPMPVWTALRELPAALGLLVDPAGERLTIAPEEVDEVLGTPRAESSIISRRRRATLASRWVLFHTNDEDRPLSPVTDDYGRKFAFAWTDQDAAAEALSPGLSLVQVPLHVALRSNPDVNVILDSGSIDQLVIDAPLREQILFVTDYFPKGYLATVAELKPEARAPYETAARTVAAAIRAAGLPLGGVWVVGYRLERAEEQIMIVVDTDLDAAQGNSAYIQLLSTVVMPEGPIVSLMKLSNVPASYRTMLEKTPNWAGAA
jgi:hypothetical protein